MVNKWMFFCLLIFVFILSFTTFAQTTAVPFLLISSSPEANGMGSASVSRITDDPYAVNYNPAHLGFLQNNFAFSFYPSKTNWLPGVNLGNQTYNSFLFCGGMSLEEYLDFPISIGIAYSRIDFNYIYLFPTSLPVNENTHKINEYCDAFSIGIGCDVGVKLAAGITFRESKSNLFYYSNVLVRSNDFGLLADFPVIDLIDKDMNLIYGTSPIFDLSLGSALTNVGKRISNLDLDLSDPLPYNLSIGTSIEIGIKLREPDYKLASFSWTRQADNELIGYDNTGSYYQGIPGDLSIIDNIIEGKWTNSVKISQGWQIGFGEIIYYRQGSFEGAGFDNIITEGFGVSTSGLFKLFELLNVANSSIAQIFNHFNLHYNQSRYSSDSSPLNSTKFSSLTIVIRL